MKYEIIFHDNDNTPRVTVNANSLHEVEVYGYAMYRGKMLGANIKCLEKDDFMMIPVAEYFRRDLTQFTDDYIADMQLTLVLAAAENKLATGNEYVGISEEQSKLIQERYELFKIWVEEDWI